MGLLGKIFGWHARANIEKAFHAIAQILFVHLQRQYSHETNETKAMELATAVTLELLGPPPDNVTSLLSLPVDTHQLEIKLNQIKNDPEVCRIISTFRHRRNNIAGAVTPDMVTSDAKLQKMGILLPVSQIQLPSSHEDLMRQVREFEIWTKRV
ncbi:MAG: hypothetical protein PHR77_01280 [Kiritimatiellae bacterium]|nr:hypothetical protein [Kiritimatiellia bacterium]MDD5522025.1 hypothetical protein [Kiritimatiellia bacterium]